MAGLFSGLYATDPSNFTAGAEEQSRLQTLQRANQNRLNQSRILQSMPDMGEYNYGSGPAFGDLNRFNVDQRQIEVPGPTVTTPLVLTPPPDAQGPAQTGPNIAADGTVTPATTSTGGQRLTNPELAGTQDSHLTIPDFDANAPIAVDDTMTFTDMAGRQVPLGDAVSMLSGRAWLTSGMTRERYNELSRAEQNQFQQDVGAAATWYESDEAYQYFARNPQAYDIARRDPLGFYKTFQNEAPMRTDRAVDRQSAERTERLITGRANRMADALQTPQVRTLVQQAQAMGVDPYAAIAIYGIESDFGGNAGTSSAGATGGMQVIDATFTGMKRWFTDPANVEQYNIPQSLVAIARGIQRGDALSEMQAGLLVIKYNELIGNPVNLWGAGYQGSADSVRRLGRPIRANDGNITNADYNRAYVELYNQAVTLLGGSQALPAAPATAAAPTTTTPAAPATTTPAQPAPVTSAQSANTGNVAVGTANASSLQVTGQPAAAPTQITVQGPRAGVGVTTTVLPPVQTSAFYLQNPAAVTRETQEARLARQRIAYQSLYAQRLARAAQVTGDNEGFVRAQTALTQAEDGLRQADAQIVYYAGMQALSELNMGSVQRASSVYSYVTGRNIQIVPRSDGNYDIQVDGQNWREGIGLSELSTQLRLEFDNAFRQSRATAAAERSQFTFEKQLEAAIARQDRLLQIYGDTIVEAAKARAAQQLELLKQQQASVSSLGDGRALVIMNGQQYFFDPMGREYTDQNGDQQIDFSLVPVSPTQTAGGTGNAYLNALNRQQ